MKDCFVKHLPGAKLITDYESMPHFCNLVQPSAVQLALDVSHGGNVNTDDHSCGGVAIQRSRWILLRQNNSTVSSRVGEASRRAGIGGACIASDLVWWCRKDGLLADHLSSWNDAKERLRQGCVVFTILNGVHWVTVIGVHQGNVYVLDYDGLFSVPEKDYVDNVKPASIFAPGCMMWVDASPDHPARVMERLARPNTTLIHLGGNGGSFRDITHAGAGQVMTIKAGAIVDSIQIGSTRHGGGGGVRTVTCTIPASGVIRLYRVETATWEDSTPVINGLVFSIGDHSYVIHGTHGHNVTTVFNNHAGEDVQIVSANSGTMLDGIIFRKP
ncbi:unnamed protein product [Didymodactylos carnosus]|uniref:Uncharacterized protein n=1 Tax=Didymodactylos carnosus TaxID=1234261 RepID=A0A814NSY4_9BILA|nr:unnamed protein product [Didymodactylos carnosus]CAF1096504.1 unnamed protein product [Didymodactylos carnosus]CAF3773800.1 unnamed protein product [Didymodactylos carnosus]CAF3861787.1 unnamed protein product [Didymodactylos carnosus]